jgi:hypothetical protein
VLSFRVWPGACGPQGLGRQLFEITPVSLRAKDERHRKNTRRGLDANFAAGDLAVFAFELDPDGNACGFF